MYGSVGAMSLGIGHTVSHFPLWGQALYLLAMLPVLYVEADLFINAKKYMAKLPA